jgi:uncharacterized membrane protein (UPF0127 family)
MHSVVKKIGYLFLFVLLAIVIWQLVIPFTKNLKKGVLTRQIEIESVSSNPQPINVAIGTTTLSVKLAVTESERAQGLGEKKFLDDNEGLLFVFPKSGYYAIWMKSMLFSIDVAWLDDQFNIMEIQSDISPSTYPETFKPEQPARYILEVNSGFFKSNGITPGMGLILVDDSDSL